MVIGGDLSGTDKSFEDGGLDAEDVMAKVGEEAAEDAKADHIYKNRARNPESSNKYEIDKGGPTLGSTAGCVSYVEVEGLDVSSGSALRVEKKPKEIFEQ